MQIESERGFSMAILNNLISLNIGGGILVFIFLLLIALFSLRNKTKREDRYQLKGERLEEYESFTKEHFLNSIIPILIFLFFIVTLCLGIYGFSMLSFYDWRSSLYSSIRLFTVNFDAPIQAPYPISLEIARWTGTITTYLTLIQIIIVAFREKFIRYFVTTFLNNTVIVGVNEFSYALAESLLKTGKSVVFISSEENEMVNKIKSYGGVIVIGDPKNYDTLRKARVTLSSNIVLFMMNDHENIEVAFRISVMKSKQKTLKRKRKSHLHMHLNDTQMQFFSFSRSTAQFPHSNQTNEHSIIYTLEETRKESSNEILKACYSDLIWEEKKFSATLSNLLY